MFDPASLGYPLQPFDKRQLEKLLNHFESEVKREIDQKLARRLRQQLLQSDPPAITRDTLKQLARWCKTDGIYGDGMDVARKISLLLFGKLVDREKLRT